MGWYTGKAGCGCCGSSGGGDSSPCSIITGVTSASEFTVEVGSFGDNLCFCDQYDGTYTLTNDPYSINPCSWGTGGTFLDPFLDLDPDPDTGANCDVASLDITFTSGVSGVGLLCQLRTLNGDYFGSAVIGGIGVDVSSLDITFQGLPGFGTNGGIQQPAGFNRPCNVGFSSFLRVRAV